MNGEPSDEHINSPDRINLLLNFLKIFEVGIIVFCHSEFHLIDIVVDAVYLSVHILQFILVDLQDHKQGRKTGLHTLYRGGDLQSHRLARINTSHHKQI